MLRASLLAGGAAGQAFATAWRHAGTTLSSTLAQTAAFSTVNEAASGLSFLYWSLKVARVAGIGVAITAVAVPVGTLAALVLTGRDEADAFELIHAVPRTLRVMWWSLWAAYNYKKLTASFAAASITEETYRENLSKMHRQAAGRLLRVCQTNGGVYVKAGQLAV